MKLNRILTFITLAIGLSGMGLQTASANEYSDRLDGKWLWVNSAYKITSFSLNFLTNSDAELSDGAGFTAQFSWGADRSNLYLDTSAQCTSRNTQFSTSVWRPLVNKRDIYYRIEERVMPKVYDESRTYLALFFNKSNYDNNNRPNMLFVLDNVIDPLEVLEVTKLTEIEIVEPEREEILPLDQGLENISMAAPDSAQPVATPATVDKVYDTAESMPEFPGGTAALFKFISDNIKYPAIAQENGIQGRVVVRFVVKKDGSIGEVVVVRSKDPDLDKEAVRLVKSLPDFTPAKNDGTPVNCWYTLPVNFRL